MTSLTIEALGRTHDKLVLRKWGKMTLTLPWPWVTSGLERLSRERRRRGDQKKDGDAVACGREPKEDD
jgi:hypothetical protein